MKYMNKIIVLIFMLLSACTHVSQSSISNIIVSTDECAPVTLSGGEQFVVWAADGADVTAAEFTLYGKALSLSSGKGLPASAKAYYAGCPAYAFNPAEGKACLQTTITWNPASPYDGFPVSASCRTGVPSKLHILPAFNVLELYIRPAETTTTLYGLSITADVPICGDGTLCHFTDGRPYVKYADGQGSHTLTVDFGQDGVALPRLQAFTLELPLPGDITLSSLSIDYLTSEGEHNEKPSFVPQSLGFGQTLSLSLREDNSMSFIAERNPHPYCDVDWNSTIYINTTSHVHCEDDRTLNNLRAHNFEFFTFANYYPSAPTYPAAQMKAGSRGIPVSDWPVMVNGQRTDGPFNWAEIVSQWADQLPAEQKAKLPLKESKEPMFPSWEEGTLEAPNAEHHSFLFDGKYYEMHLCCPGSSYSSGTFDARDRFGTVKYGGYCYGCGEHWRVSIGRMLEALVIPDGGGVTINHPGWSNLDNNFILQLLDCDPRVLGMEVLNTEDNDEDYWDAALATGRQCFGFFVPDHGAQNIVPIEKFGVNVLLVPERTTEACLRAYRRGDFYGAEHGLGELFFTSITYDGTTVRASVDKEAKLEVITAAGVTSSVVGASIEYVCKPGDVYARVRASATDGCGEILYSQPFIL